jgi:hypothetical protein
MAAPTIFPSGALNVSPPQGFVEIADGPTKSQFRMVSGTFTLNGATPVAVAETSIAATSMVLISLKTPAGTVGAQPAVQSITAGTGFSVAGTANDTSTYNYLVIG